MSKKNTNTTQPESDIQILANEFLRTKSDKVFKTIIKRMTPGLHQHIMNIEKEQERRVDIINDVFSKVWEKIDQYNVERGQFSTWVYRIALNEVLISKMYGSKNVSWDVLTEYQSNSTFNVTQFNNSINYSIESDDEYDNKRTGAIIDELYGVTKQLMRDFPENTDRLKKWKRAFLLKDVEGMKFQDIAKLMGENENSVKGWVCKSRNIVARMLSEKYPNLVENYMEYCHEYEKEF